MLINTKIIPVHEDIKRYVTFCSIHLLLQLFGHFAADTWWNAGSSYY